MKPIKTQTDHKAAITRISELMDIDPSPGSDQDIELEVLAILVETYEKEHFKRDLPDPIEAIRFRMEQQELTNKDLEPIFGGRSKVSEVLNRKRPLSISMIHRLNKQLGLSAEVLIGTGTQRTKRTIIKAGGG